MVTFSNPVYEQLFNAIFTQPKEQELKMVLYESGFFAGPNMYISDDSNVGFYEEGIAKAERDIEKAKKAMALFKLMRDAGVTYNEEEQEE